MGEVSCLLIRHGKTAGNIEKRYIGCRTDEELCESGIEELNGSSLMDEGPNLYEKVFVSPLLRCMQTADILVPMCEKVVVDDFKEIDFGRFENKNYLELKDDIDYQRWLDSNGELSFPDGEPRELFITRNVKAFKNVIRQVAGGTDGRLIPFVAHGGSIMAIMSELTGKDYYDFQIPCGCAYKLTCEVREENIDVISYDRISCGCDS